MSFEKEMRLRYERNLLKSSEDPEYDESLTEEGYDSFCGRMEDEAMDRTD